MPVTLWMNIRNESCICACVVFGSGGDFVRFFFSLFECEPKEQSKPKVQATMIEYPVAYKLRMSDGKTWLQFVEFPNLERSADEFRTVEWREVKDEGTEQAGMEP